MSSKDKKKKRRADGAAGKKGADEDRDLIRIKITSCGEGGVGKSCIIKRYCEEKFVSRYIAVSAERSTRSERGSLKKKRGYVAVSVLSW